MPARTSRLEARQRLEQMFKRELDRLIPADEAVALKGQTFLEWEESVTDLTRTLGQIGLEERAKLDASAEINDAESCPYCKSSRVYLKQGAAKSEIHSPHGPVEIDLQSARCRACNGTFSPSEARVAPARRSAADQRRRRTPRARIGHTKL